MKIDFKKHINARIDKPLRPYRCIKSLHDYSFHIKCTCGVEVNVESFYWNAFKYCPGCGTTCEED